MRDALRQGEEMQSVVERVYSGSYLPFAGEAQELSFYDELDAPWDTVATEYNAEVGAEVRAIIPREGRKMWLPRMFLLLGLPILIGCGDPLYREAPAPGAVDISVAAFPDDTLRGIFQSDLERYSREEVRRLNLDVLERVSPAATTEELREARIGSLLGLEQLRALRRLEAADNAIRSVDVLALTPRLEYLDLSGNAVRDIRALGELPYLETLILRDNGISDLEQFKEIESLRHLDLADNPWLRGDPGALVGLGRLRYLGLKGCAQLDRRQVEAFRRARPEVTVAWP